MDTQKLNDQHYLNVAYINEERYHKDFLDMFNNFCRFLSPAQKKMLNQKLQLSNNKKFNEGSFVQIACETTVCSFFAKKYPNRFLYEYKTTVINEKDVDCQFTDGNFTYNVEVKCPGLETYKEKFNETPKIEMKGRFSEGGRKLTNTIEKALQDKLEGDKSEWNYVVKKRLDNTLKTFLQESHNKFPSIEITDQVNVLIVCCDDQKDMDRWIGYLYNAGGLFTDDSFSDTNTYSRVDIVVLTNLLNRHYSFVEKTIQGNSWCFSDAFNLCFCNPFKNNTYKEVPIRNFTEKLDNFTMDLINFVDREIDNNPVVEHFPVQYFAVELKKSPLYDKNKVYPFAIWNRTL